MISEVQVEEQALLRFFLPGRDERYCEWRDWSELVEDIEGCRGVDVHGVIGRCVAGGGHRADGVEVRCGRAICSHRVVVSLG